MRSTQLPGSSLRARALHAHSEQQHGPGQPAPPPEQPTTTPLALPAAPAAAATARKHLWREFQAVHYSGEAMALLDCLFFATHCLMTALHKRLLVTRREQRVFEAALSLFAGALLLILIFRRTYNRVRPGLVFVTHVACTLLRAAAVATMASKQAVHFRMELVSASDSPVALLLTMLSVLGGPFRLFEMLGLQQRWTHHVAITMLYLVVHPLTAMHGIRLAYSNTMFYLVHRVHDAVAAVVDGALAAAAGLPPLHQQTCSSCAGVAIYATMCLFGSVLAPLYLMHVAEQAAFVKWCAQQAAAQAGTAARLDSDPAEASTREAQQPQQVQRGRQQEQQQPDFEAGSSGSSQRRTSRPGSSGGLPGSTTSTSRSSGGSGGSQHTSTQGQPAPWQHAIGPLAVEHILLRWCVHLLVLLCLLVASWMAGNVFALVVLPRLLGSKELALWCPNRPYAPYVIAGEVYEGYY